MKIAVLRVNVEMLEKVLGVPEGGEVIEVRQRPGYHGEIELIVAGIGMETPPGAPLPPGSQGFVRTQMSDDGFELSYSIEWSIISDSVAATDPWTCRCQHPKGGRRSVDPAKNGGMPFVCNECGQPWSQSP